MRGPADRRAWRVALALALGLVGCATARPPPPAAPIPAGRVAELTQRWAEEWKAFQGFRAAIDLTVKNERRNERAAAVLLIAPNALRVEVTAPFGLPTVVATAGPEEILVYRVLERRAHTAQATPAAVGRWLGVPVPPHTLIRLLVGSVPVPAEPGLVTVESAPRPHLTWSEDGTRYRLFVTEEGLPSRLLLEAPGGERLTADFRWKGAGELTELQLSAPAREAELTVRYLAAEYVASPPEAFRLALPRNVPVEPLD